MVIIGAPISPEPEVATASTVELPVNKSTGIMWNTKYGIDSDSGTGSGLTGQDSSMIGNGYQMPPGD